MIFFLDKLQAGKIRCNPQEFDLPDFLNELIEESKQLQKTEQDIKFEQTGTQNIFYSDPHILKNILLNFLSNAIKYSADGKCIRLKSLLSAKKIDFFVEDEGIGIPQADQQHMFERFFRAKNAGNIQGTGLGLNIVQQYVQLLGGTIDFKSRENEGSTFHISIPYYREKTINNIDL
jgi:signal transduction histidine kinase